ncbi:SDR family oxidoreductase [Phaeovulum sp.]|uniref:SDR family oxidoreductase n=1 Tax=Phaeovulum sp. TaxID=2934796 RepID=UPI0035668452
MGNKVLVSGATGFIAGHTIERLLAAGHEVVGTVRNPADEAKLAHFRTMPGAERLQLVAADLTDADPFSAYTDVDTIMHMASPYRPNVADAQRDLVDPAVQGTLSMLRAAAAQPRVRRVVLTSSMAAVTDEPDGRVLTEADWNNKSSLTRNPYYYSKALAECAAWKFVARERPGYDLVVINPFLVIGPSHTSAVNTSPEIFINIIKGVFPAVLSLNWGVVDVRDVADAHIAAMERPKAAGRYLCVGDAMSMAEAVALMRAEGFGAKLPRLSMTGAIGTAVMKAFSYTQPVGTGSYLRTNLGRTLRFDASKSQNELGIHYRDAATSLRDTLADLARWGHIAKSV